MTNEKVMFEFGGKMWDANGQHYHLDKDGNLVIGEFRTGGGETLKILPFQDLSINNFYLAKHTAQLKAQGWLSPEDQRPFCMESAIASGYYFVEGQKYMFGGYMELEPFVHTVMEGEVIDPKGKTPEEEILWWYPVNLFGFPDLHETRRLEALGVKRKEKGGE